jgi:hypothetical protein
MLKNLLHSMPAFFYFFFFFCFLHTVRCGLHKRKRAVVSFLRRWYPGIYSRNPVNAISWIVKNEEAEIMVSTGQSTNIRKGPHMKSSTALQQCSLFRKNKFVSGFSSPLSRFFFIFFSHEWRGIGNSANRLSVQKCSGDRCLNSV